MAGKSGKLPVKVKMGYGVADIGGQIFFNTINFWLINYLTDNVGLAAGLAGIAVLIGRVFDAITDPAMGYISDRTRTGWGRRRPYIFAGSFFMFGAMVILWTNPHFDGQVPLFVWAAASYSFLNLAFTVVNIPYSSMTPELTDDYNERTSLNGYRMTFAVLGTFIGAGAALPIIGAFANPDAGYTIMGTIFGGVMCLSALVTFFAVKEPPLPATPPPKGKIFSSYGQAFRNKPFVLILLPWVFNNVAITILSGSLIYYFRVIYGVEDNTTTIALLVLLASAMVFIPVWTVIAKKIGKKLSYIIGISVLAAGVILFFFIGAGSITAAFVVMAIAGFGFATHYVMPWSIIPDTIEYDYAKTGIRREGVYYGLWTFVLKIGQGLGALMIGWILAGFDYSPGAETAGPAAQLGIRLLFGPIAAVFFIAGVIVLIFFPITRKVYQDILAESEKRQAEQGTV